MNHQIQHHSYIGAACRKGRKTVGFNELGLSSGLLKVGEDRIEALHMAYLKNAAMLICQANQLSRLRGVIGHGLFDQDVLASSKQPLRDVKMGDGRSDDAQCVGSLKGLFHRSETRIDRAAGATRWAVPDS